MRPVTYALETPDPLASYVLAFALEALRLPAREVTAPGAAALYYGARAPRSGDAVWIRRAQGLPTPAELNGPEDARAEDPVRAIGALLTDQVNAGAAGRDFDRHGRLRGSASFQAAAQALERPLVNAYLARIGEALHGRLKQLPPPRWPEGRRCAIALSHDVDNPDKYAILQRRLPRGGSLREQLEALIRWGYYAVKRVVRYSPDDYWLFDEVLDEEMRHGFSSAFYFAARHYGEPGSSPHDVPYDIRDAKFQPVFKRIAREGFEVGLHASYNAHRDCGLLREEKARLESTAETAIEGVRHHYFQLGPDPEATFLQHERVGFAYDSSIAWSDCTGFRRSIALPFRPWHSGEQRAIQCYQLPVMAMDANLIREGAGPDGAVALAWRYVETLKRCGGAGALDWHLRCSYPKSREFGTWGEAYCRLLARLAADDDVWVTTPSSLISWWRQLEPQATNDIGH